MLTSGQAAGVPAAAAAQMSTNTATTNDVSMVWRMSLLAWGVRMGGPPGGERFPTSMRDDSQVVKRSGCDGFELDLGPVGTGALVRRDADPEVEVDGGAGGRAGDERAGVGGPFGDRLPDADGS